jgi:hypothetical protein
MVYLKLFNGTYDPSIDPEGDGVEGPVFGPLKYVHVTSGFHIKFLTQNPGCDNEELWVINDFVYYDGVYYVDWNVFNSYRPEFDGPCTKWDRDKVRPVKKYLVGVNRTSHQTTEVEVFAVSKSAAVDIAAANAGTYTYDEHDADYEVGQVVEVKESKESE